MRDTTFSTRDTHPLKYELFLRNPHETRSEIGGSKLVWLMLRLETHDVENVGHGALHRFLPNHAQNQSSTNRNPSDAKHCLVA